MIDKNYCMSSYLAFRFIERDDVDFFEGLHHKNPDLSSDSPKIAVHTAEDLDKGIKQVFDCYKDKKMGLLLSGGMDSANMAAYMPGSDAYTFRYLGGKFGDVELHRAEYYANRYDMKLHYVDIDWNTVEAYTDILMKAKASPIHSIEPQVYQAALQAKNDGVEMIITGEGCDVNFGGMSNILSQDWKIDDFEKMYTFLDPALVLTDPVDVSYVYEKYRKGDKIDFIGFLHGVFSVESVSSFQNACDTAGVSLLAPVEKFEPAEPLDLTRIRNGEPKYLIRELFSMNYPEIPIPDKVPMPRPVDVYFQNWGGPKRPEFKENIDMTKLTGNQKWQLYCLERFLNLYDNY